MTGETISEAARKARNEYKRQWNKRNADKRRAQQRRYWERRAAKTAAEQEQQPTAED